MTKNEIKTISLNLVTEVLFYFARQKKIVEE